MCALFAASHPDQVSSLILIDTAARGSDVMSQEHLRWLGELIESRWGKGDLTALYAPSMVQNERFRRWMGRLERLSVSPHGAHQLLELTLASDISAALPRITCPTLVIHHRENTLVPVELGQAVAAAIPDARFTTVAGEDSMAWLGDGEGLIGEIEEFLTGSRTPAPANELRAIMFTDIVGSTELAAQLHHKQWQQLLSEHYQLVRREIELCGGCAVKAMGDGFLATFTEPEQAIRAASEVVGSSPSLGLDVRAGIHVGAVERLPDDVRGIAVHIAARTCEEAEPGTILVTGTVRDILVDSEIPFGPVSERELRGVPGRWTLHEVSATASGENKPRLVALAPSEVGALGPSEVGDDPAGRA
jgi:class 3 adenylate cyclase